MRLSLPDINDLAATGGYSLSTELTNFSAALILSASGWFGDIRNWEGVGYELTPSEIDEIDAKVSELLSQVMTNSRIGEVFFSVILPVDAPDSWLLLDGTFYNASFYPALWEVLPPSMKNPTTNQILLPDLRGAVVGGTSGASPNEVATSVGDNDRSLSIANLPPHNHSYTRPVTTPIPIQAGAAGGVFTQALPGITGSAGSGASFDNRQRTVQLVPYIVAS